MQVLRDGPAPMISALRRDIGLTDTIDRMVSWDEKRSTLSPGLGVEATISKALIRRCPLYRVDHFSRDVDVAKLFGSTITPRQLNDDAMGRALDKVTEANTKEVYAPWPCRRCAVRASVWNHCMRIPSPYPSKERMTIVARTMRCG